MSNIQMLFEHADALNREGISCLILADSNGAYTNFKLALQIMTEITCLAKDMDDATMGEVLELTKAVPVPLSNDSSFYVYNHALLFQPHAAPSKRAMAFCVSVLIFNMALTYHQRGLAKAATLYGQAMLLLEDTIETGDGSSGDYDVHMLQVLAQNNQIHMLSLTGETQQVIDGCEALRFAISSLKVTDNMAVEDGPLTEIILNLLIPLTSCMAAAA